MEKYIEATTFTGSDFKVMTAFEGWKIGFLRYSDRFSDFKVIERHICDTVTIKESVRIGRHTTY